MCVPLRRIATPKARDKVEEEEEDKDDDKDDELSRQLYVDILTQHEDEFVVRCFLGNEWASACDDRWSLTTQPPSASSGGTPRMSMLEFLSFDPDSVAK